MCGLPATEIEQDVNSMVTTDAEGCTDTTGDNANPKGEEEALPFDLLKVCDCNIYKYSLLHESFP